MAFMRLKIRDKMKYGLKTSVGDMLRLALTLVERKLNDTAIVMLRPSFNLSFYGWLSLFRSFHSNEM